MGIKVWRSDRVYNLDSYEDLLTIIGWEIILCTSKMFILALLKGAKEHVAELHLLFFFFYRENHLLYRRARSIRTNYIV